MVGKSGVSAPPSSHAVANPFSHRGSATTALAHNATRGVGGPTGTNWGTSFNGVHQAGIQHTAARPAFGTGGSQLGGVSHNGFNTGAGPAMDRGGGAGALRGQVNADVCT